MKKKKQQKYTVLKIFQGGETWRVEYLQDMYVMDS